MPDKDLLIRWSRNVEKYEIRDLLKLCFGMREDFEFNENINDKYLVGVIDNKVIAVTGLVNGNLFWTCTHPDYRHKGIMTEMLTRLLQTTDETVFAMCWHIGYMDRPNLASLMDKFGFVKTGTYSCHYEKNPDDTNSCVNSIEDCPFGRDREICSCTNDAYTRYGSK